MSTPTTAKFQTAVPSTNDSCGLEEILTQLANEIEVTEEEVTMPGNAPLPKDPPN